MPNRIEKIIELKSTPARVWRALTDYEEFGEWFKVRLDGPFRVDKDSRGVVTYPGYEGLRWDATVTAMDPERLFAFTWCPTANEPGVDYSGEPRTLVEFQLTATKDGSRLVISESGFDALPEGPTRDEALRVNTQGWDIQAENIAAHVDG